MRGDYYGPKGEKIIDCHDIHAHCSMLLEGLSRQPKYISLLGFCEHIEFTTI